MTLRSRILTELELTPLWQQCTRQHSEKATASVSPTPVQHPQTERAQSALSQPEQNMIDGIGSLTNLSDQSAQSEKTGADLPALGVHSGSGLSETWQTSTADPTGTADQPLDRQIYRPSTVTPLPIDRPLPPNAREQLIAEMDWHSLYQTVGQCTDCGLCKTRTRTVFGVGSQPAKWLIIGEAPGAEEDKQGEPFVGQAGKLLDNMLAALSLCRDKEVFIANILKCRPPGNRDPNSSEVQQCKPFLLRQIALIQPRIIIALGRIAAQNLLQTDARIGDLRGRVHHLHEIPLIITYHPAYLLRSPLDKAKAWQDLCLAKNTFDTLDPS